jgi:uncharacterized protein (UPF0332 family)
LFFVFFKGFSVEGSALSLSGNRAAEKHLRLAEGLIKTAKISDAASEYEIRNAFSRSYYALFHACCGYLWAAGIDVNSLGRKHGRLHDEMGRWVGKSFGNFLRSSYELRRKSDYIPEWNPPPQDMSLGMLISAQKQCYFVMVTGRKLCSD